jgi:uroporphyrinogen-III synthase
MIEKKLAGKTILNTRPLEQSLLLVEAIEREGGQCLMLPSVEIVPVFPKNQEIYPNIQSHYWIFLSQYAVKVWVSQYHFFAAKIAPKIIAIGKATATALQKANISVNLIPEESSSEGILHLLDFQSLEGKTVTIFRGKSGRTLLDDTLIQRGALVNEVVLYERLIPTWTPQDYALLNHPIDLALGLSVDSLTYFFSKLDFIQTGRFFNVPWLVMSQRVAEEAKKLGVSEIYKVSDGDIFESLIRCCSPGIIGGDFIR